jgi:hypothetical protein
MECTSLDYKVSRLVSSRACSPEFNKQLVQANSKLACLCSAEPSATIKDCRLTLMLCRVSAANKSFRSSWTRQRVTFGVHNEEASVTHEQECNRSSRTINYCFFLQYDH